MNHSVPWVRAGKSRNPQEGGCIMQIVDWIERERWTDRPLCVADSVRLYAIYVNDMSTDKERQRLLDLIPKMMGTNRLLTNEQVVAADSVNAKFNNVLHSIFGYGPLVDAFERYLDEYNAVINHTPKAVGTVRELVPA